VNRACGRGETTRECTAYIEITSEKPGNLYIEPRKTTSGFETEQPSEDEQTDDNTGGDDGGDGESVLSRIVDWITGWFSI